VLIRAKFTEDSRVEYLAPTKPAQSRVVDFSKNVSSRPESDANVAYGETDTSFGNACAIYDSGSGYWMTKSSSVSSDSGKSRYHNFFNKNIPGDFFCLLEDVGTTAPWVFWWDKDNFGTSVGSAAMPAEARYWGGLARISIPCGVYNPLTCAKMEMYGSNSGAKYKMIYAGFTYPINMVLWSGAVGGALHQKQWQSDGSGVVSTYNASTACANATKDVCAKLKADWGKNLRMYVIKYRKQTSYKNKINGSTASFDYDYLKYCAGAGNTTSSNSTPYMYDVTTESQLKSALTAIAADIKTFAGYKGVKTVVGGVEEIVED
jgi:hypothetical protein